MVSLTTWVVDACNKQRVCSVGDGGSGRVGERDGRGGGHGGCNEAVLKHGVGTLTAVAMDEWELGFERVIILLRGD